MLHSRWQGTVGAGRDGWGGGNATGQVGAALVGWGVGGVCVGSPNGRGGGWWQAGVGMQ